MGGSGFWGRDVYDKPRILRALGVPTQVRATDYREASPDAIGQDMGLSYAGNINAGIEFRRDVGVCAEEAEYSCAIHRDVTNPGPLQGVVKDSGDVGGKNVVVTGGPGPGEREGGNGGIVR